MKKLLLIIFLISSNVIAQSINDRLDLIQEQVEAIRAELSIDQDPVSNITAQLIRSDRIEIKWTANSSGHMDIQYYRPGVDKDWQHSIWRYRAPVEIEDQYTSIGVNFNVTWMIRAVSGDWVSEPVVVQPYIESSEPPIEPNPEIDPDILWGWWYDQAGEDRNSANTIKVWADDIPQALSTDFKVIPFIGEGGSLDHNSSLNDFRKRYENKGRHLKDVSREKVPVVILGDEPDAFPVEKLEALIDIAREVINPDLEYTFSFRRTNIHPNRDVLPQNTGIIWWNHYPFRGKDYPNPYIYVHDRETFFESSNQTLDIARELAPDAQFIISTQAFSQFRPGPKVGGDVENESDWQFRTPHPDSPLWYAKWISENEDVLGGFHFVYSGNYAKTAVDLPELLQNIEQVYNEITIQ